VETLCQLLRNEAGKLVAPGGHYSGLALLPAARLPVRHRSRQTIDVEFCKRVIRESARYKLNAIMFYMEDDYKFEKYPFLGRPEPSRRPRLLSFPGYAEPYHVMLNSAIRVIGPRRGGAVSSRDEWICARRWQRLGFLHLRAEGLGVPRQCLRGAGGSFPQLESTSTSAATSSRAASACVPSARRLSRKRASGRSYARHMNKLNDLCKQHHRTMLFWPSHAGDDADHSYLTLKNADKMERDCIPTEWIYHGPAAYPELGAVPEAGFKDVFVSPAVVDYSVIWPTTRRVFRGIRGFYKAGRMPALPGGPCGGALCTTWEFMYGALFENSWYGLIYCGECGWSLGRAAGRITTGVSPLTGWAIAIRRRRSLSMTPVSAHSGDRPGGDLAQRHTGAEALLGGSRQLPPQLHAA